MSRVADFQRSSGQSRVTIYVTDYLCYDLPRVQRFIFDEDSEGNTLEFRMVYKGRLPAETSKPRVQDKHRIRKELHLQIRDLWQRTPVLTRQLKDKIVTHVTPANLVGDPGPNVVRHERYPHDDPRGRPWVEHVADNYSRCGYRFVPLVRESNGFTCSLDVLFLRRGHPGDIYRHHGDLDNRIKVLLDALSTPLTCDQIPKPPGVGEDPFFTLLEDDKFVTSLTVTSDRLLIPMTESESEGDVEVVIHAKIIDPSAILGERGLI
jgi:hypothetical protein